MKRIIILLISVLPAFSLFAQEDDDFKTIFDGSPLHISGFGGPFMNFTAIDGEFAHMMGGGGGIIINDFFFGGFGLGLTTSHDPSYYSGEQDVEFGYGGLWFGHTLFSDRAIHPSAHLQVGWGGITVWEGEYDHDNFLEEDGVFVVSPTVELEANITRFFKMGVGVRYRFVQGVEMVSYDNSDFSDFGAFLSFKFGWFDNY